MSYLLRNDMRVDKILQNRSLPIFNFKQMTAQHALAVFAVLLIATCSGPVVADDASIHHRVRLQAKSHQNSAAVDDDVVLLLQGKHGGDSRLPEQQQEERADGAGVHDKNALSLIEHSGQSLFGVLTGNVKIGGQDFEVAFTSGYSDIWVFGEALEGEIKNSEEFDHTFYDPSKSKTHRQFRALTPYNFQYYNGDLVVGGERFYDTISVGSINAKNALIVALNKFENKRSSKMASLGFSDRIFNADDIDGIVGLGLGTLPGTTAEDHPILQGIKQFAIYTSGDGLFGELHLGGWDQEFVFEFGEEMSFVPVLGATSSNKKSSKNKRVVLMEGRKSRRDNNDDLHNILLEQHFWKLKTSITLHENYGHATAVIDSGVGAIYAPKNFVTDFFKEIGIKKGVSPPGAGGADDEKNSKKNKKSTSNSLSDVEDDDFRLKDGYYMPCSELKNLPYLTFGFHAGEEGGRGASISLSPHEYFQISKFELNRCEPLLLPHANNWWTLGGPVFRKYYTVFDVARKQMGFGLANHMEFMSLGDLNLGSTATASSNSTTLPPLHP